MLSVDLLIAPRHTALRLLALCTLALALVGNGHAQVPGGGKGKAALALVQRMDVGAAQDLIVVYDDQAIEAQSRLLQSQTGLPAHHARILEHKAAGYAARQQEVMSSLGAGDATVLKHYGQLPASFVRLHSRQALERLLAHPGVAGVYENRIEKKTLAESLPLVGQPQVAAAGNLGAGTAVAVLDTGVDYTRAAFGSCTSPGVPAGCKVAYAQDFAPNDGSLDNDGHGTNVAGIVLGVAPGTKILALDVFSGSAAAGNLSASASDILSAISWVIANKATYNVVAISMSLGSGRYTSPVTSGVYNAAVAQAHAAGILTIAASGNDGYSDSMAAPGAVQGVVSVGAVYDSAMGAMNWGAPSRCQDVSTAADKVTCFSNSASFLTLLAPGSQITAAGITESGTSQATPHVAGAVAVLRAAYPAETLDQTVARLTNGQMVTDSRNDIQKPRLHLPTALALAASCSYSLSETSRTFSSVASSASVAISSAAGCPWSAASSVSDAGWISVTAGSSGSANGTVSYSVASNNNQAARTGTLTVAGQTVTVIQSGSVGNVSNILLNPGFDDGPTAWTETTANGYPVITAYLNPTTTNSWYAWLCGYNNCADQLRQDVTVPADAQSAYLQFNYWIDTTEVSTLSAYDSLQIRVYSPPTATTYSYWTLTNLNATTGWVMSPRYDLSAFKGQTIRLEFAATTDSTNYTNFYLDDVNLMVSGAVPDTQAPATPLGVAASATGASAIRVDWLAASDNVGVTGYRVYRDGLLLATPGKVLSYIDSGLPAAAAHSYRVAACDGAGNCSAQSLASSATTPAAFTDTQAPTVPAGFSGAGTSVSSIGLSWAASTDNVGVTQYKVYRNGTLLAAVGNVLSYGDTGLTPTTSYSYTVSACDLAGNCSAQSQALSVSTQSPFNIYTPIIIDGAVSATWGGTTANLTIAKISNRSMSMISGSLRIEFWAYATPFSGPELGYKTASIRTASITGAADQLQPNSSFTGITLSLAYQAPPAGYTHYAVFVSEYSSTCSAADKFCYDYYVNLNEVQAPTVPTALTAQVISSSQVNLTWAASTDNVGVATYQVYRNGLLVAVLGNVTSYSDIGLTGSTMYSYTVAACDAVANCSAPSATAVATTLVAPDTQAPSVPTGLTATATSSTHISLSWLPSTDNLGVTAYKVYSNGTLVATLANVTSSIRTNAPATTYRYTVAACDAAGNCSAQSAAVSATTPAQSDLIAPTVPAGLSASASASTAIHLSWGAATDSVGVTSYVVYRGGTALATLGNVTSYDDLGLRESTAYSYAVQACDAAANCSAQSAPATATTAAAPTLALSYVANWNLLGNGSTAAIDVTTVFSDVTRFQTVWKWNAAKGSWAFYSPVLAAQGGTALADYVAAKGYQSLTSIAGGEGFWVNAKLAGSVSVPGGSAVDAAAMGAGLVTGWNLVAMGNDLSPPAFNGSLSATPPAPGTVPVNLTTLWAWDNALTQWYFYSPALDGNGTLASYVGSKNYLDFAGHAKTLGKGVGFWVNKP